ncbi:MAG: CDGSH iron-sulfur domain-containing protein [Chloroflexota bacterium]|nr:CDGSH iron-sulfur domain-containing protein [Chloroflexota bacterium]MCY3638891.1 CDGSH iron-sulfur domain-containing protein [Chloroflexota bacterium]MDE2685937.1 CDGSH iron-sulfur domain-containing protein [Chloroflexota bacterium]MYC06074.1 CDGSH iron-sulfur domain-containing protein [Chloroflexota bacterium]
MADTTVTTRKNGPYMVQGGIKIVDADGNEVAIDGDSDMVFLCRCGESANKPFCDGQHRKVGFEA